MPTFPNLSASPESTDSYRLDYDLVRNREYAFERIVSDATQRHEREVAKEWGALSEWLREGPGFRAMVRTRIGEVLAYGVDDDRQAVY